VLTADLSDVAETAVAQATAVATKILAALRGPMNWWPLPCMQRQPRSELFSDHAFASMN